MFPSGGVWGAAAPRLNPAPEGLGSALSPQLRTDSAGGVLGGLCAPAKIQRIPQNFQHIIEKMKSYFAQKLLLAVGA